MPRWNPSGVCGLAAAALLCAGCGGSKPTPALPSSVGGGFPYDYRDCGTAVTIARAPASLLAQGQRAAEALAALTDAPFASKDARSDAAPPDLRTRIVVASDQRRAELVVGDPPTSPDTAGKALTFPGACAEVAGFAGSEDEVVALGRAVGNGDRGQQLRDQALLRLQQAQEAVAAAPGRPTGTAQPCCWSPPRWGATSG